MNVDTTVILVIPPTKEGRIVTSLQWQFYDEYRKAWIVTAVKARIEVEFGRPEVVLFLEELVTRDGQPLRYTKGTPILDRDAWTQEYLDWTMGPMEQDFKGEVYNYREFRYLVHKIVPEFTPADETGVANPKRSAL